MKRRELLLASAALLAASGSHAQAQRMRRIGVLFPGTQGQQGALLDPFAKRLGELGWVQGKTIAIESRYADNRHERLPALAKELIEQKVELIVTGSTPAALAAKNSTSSVPVVFSAVSDPVALGLVQSLGRPGGNATGTSSLVLEVAAKQLELLKALVPKLERAAVLLTPGHPANRMLTEQLQRAGAQAGVALVVVEAGTPEALEPAFVKAESERAAAMVIPPDPLYFGQRTQIAQLAKRHRIATAFAARGFVVAGGLVSYGINYVGEFVRTAVYVDKILRGAKPADLPVEQADRFEIVVTRKAAADLGLTIPQAVLLQATEVIE